jgi:hypothetical protein
LTPMESCSDLIETLARWLHERRVELARRQGVHIFETTWEQAHPITKLLCRLQVAELLPLLTGLPRLCEASLTAPAAGRPRRPSARRSPRRPAPGEPPASLFGPDRGNTDASPD